MIEKLLHQVRTNDRRAQQEFYKKYAEQLFRLTYRYVSNEQDAGSIVNMGFFKIFRSIYEFEYRNELSLFAWMKKIVINEALIFIRKRVNYSDLDEYPEPEFISADIPENDLLLEDYYRLIRSLPEDLRTVFNLYAIDGFSHKEIAMQLNLKEASSRVYLTRARKILQQNLRKNG